MSSKQDNSNCESAGAETSSSSEDLQVPFDCTICGGSGGMVDDDVNYMMDYDTLAHVGCKLILQKGALDSYKAAVEIDGTNLPFVDDAVYENGPYSFAMICINNDDSDCEIVSRLSQKMKACFKGGEMPDGFELVYVKFWQVSTKLVKNLFIDVFMSNPFKYCPVEWEVYGENFPGEGKMQYLELIHKIYCAFGLMKNLEDLSLKTQCIRIIRKIVTIRGDEPYSHANNFPHLNACHPPCIGGGYPPTDFKPGNFLHGAHEIVEKLGVPLNAAQEIEGCKFLYTADLMHDVTSVKLEKGDKPYCHDEGMDETLISINRMKGFAMGMFCFSKELHKH